MSGAMTTLTPAQGRALRAYFDALSRGEAGSAAAGSLGIAYQTFRNHVDAAYRWLGATNIVQAAIALGLMSWDAGSSSLNGGRSNQRHLEDKAAEKVRAAQFRQLLEAAAPLVAEIPTAILRPIVYLLERSGGRYMRWEQVEAMEASALRSFVLDQVGGGWGMRDVDLGFILRELGVEPVDGGAS